MNALNLSSSPGPPAARPAPGGRDYQVFFFSELRGRPIGIGNIKNRIGKVCDLAFKVAEPYPEAVGILIDHGWGKPSEFIPWGKIARIEEDFIFVNPPDPSAPAARKTTGTFPPFVDQPGWILLDQHLMGKTILDMDGRRTEVVNDVHLLASQGRMILVHVDLSFNGFLRKWRLYRFLGRPDQFINWKYVQPLSLEDAVAKDAVSLSITRKQTRELPPEDLADTLEELTGKEQEAFFLALGPQAAAEALVEAEPRTQRQLIADLRQERARNILSEMSIPQLVDLLSVLPHDETTKMMNLLPAQQLDRVKTLLTERETIAESLMGSDYLAQPRDGRVAEVLATIRNSGKAHDAISYIYVVNSADKILLGVVDLRELVLAADDKTLGEIMTSPVVCAEADDTRDDLVEIFAKYHFRMIPVVDKQDHLLGAIHYNDIMKGLVTRARA